MHVCVVSVVVVVVVSVALTVGPVAADGDEDLDPFDMLNFDHASMKMKKSPPSEEHDSSENQPHQEHDTEPTPPQPQDDEQPAPKKQGSEAPPVKEGETKTSAGDGPPKDQPSQSPAVSCPALSLFQQFVSRLLRVVRGNVSQMEGTSTELCVRLRLTPSQLEALDSFKNDHYKDKVFTAHDILFEAVQGAHVLDSDDPNIRHLWFEEKFGLTVEKAIQVLVFLVLLLALGVVLSKLRFSWALVRWMIFIAVVMSVGMTWYRLYKGEVAKQHNAMMKDLPQGCTRLPESSGTFGNLYNLYSHYFTFQQDACLAYYEHLFVDPIVQVSPMEALAVAVVQTVMKPMRTVGTEISQFIRALVKDLPVQWQMVSVVMVFACFALVLFLSSGYSIRVPFLLAIEPAPRLGRADDVRALETQVRDLQALVDNIGTAENNQNPMPLPQPQPSQAVVATVPPPEAASFGTAENNQNPMALPKPQPSQAVVATASFGRGVGHDTEGDEMTRRRQIEQESQRLPAVDATVPPESSRAHTGVHHIAEGCQTSPRETARRQIDDLPVGVQEESPVTDIENFDVGAQASWGRAQPGMVEQDGDRNNADSASVSGRQRGDSGVMDSSAAVRNVTVSPSAENPRSVRDAETVGRMSEGAN